MRYIREGRFGPPKCFKTGAVVGSYPKPMLVFSLDSGGLDILPPRGYVPKNVKGQPVQLELDSCYEDVVWCMPEEVAGFCTKAPDEVPRILAVDFSSYRMEQVSELYTPRASVDGYQQFVYAMQALGEATSVPWATVVVDPATGLSDIVHQHVAKLRPKRIEDTMKWTVDVGYQIVKCQGSLSIIKAHTVLLMHETAVMEQDSDERSSTLKELRPMLPSKYARERIGTLFSQYFYQSRSFGKPEVKTADNGYIRANLGARWPLGLPETVGPLYKDIYERPT